MNRKVAVLHQVTPAAKSTNGVHAAFAGNTDSTKAELDLGTLADGNLDTVIRAAVAGTQGNSIKVRFTGDSPASGGVTLVEPGDGSVIVHYESGVSTVGNVETAIGTSTLIEVKTTGTGATILDSATDNTPTSALAGAVNGYDFPGPFTNPVTARNLRVVMATNYDGGDVVVAGTDPTGRAISETFTHGSNVTRVGLLIFATVTSATKAATAGANAATVSIGTGDTIGLPYDVKDAFGRLDVDGTIEAVTVSALNKSFIPTTAPDGAKVFTLIVNV